MYSAEMAMGVSSISIAIRVRVLFMDTVLDKGVWV